MTAQISDEILFQGAVYELTGIDGEGLFDPAEHGLEPQPTCTACWHGHVCHYEVRDERLILSALDVNLEPLEGEAGPRPDLFGVAAMEAVERSMFDTRYEDLDAELRFTGGLLIARDFIDELYVHMGFHPAWKYRDVRELVFEEGRLIASRDVSAQMEVFRADVSASPLEPGSGATRAEVEAWIRGTFVRRYDL